MPGKVAVIGGGPSGAACSFFLARAGIDVFLFERNPHREKPCGGGLSFRALTSLPGGRAFPVDGADIFRLRLISPDGHAVDLLLNDPIRVVSRKDLDAALRRLATSAGAISIEETVRKPMPSKNGGWRVNGRQVDIVVGAGGINDPLARFLGLPIPSRRRGQALGVYIPGRFPRQIICRFFRRCRGYAWWFPRPDNASLGIALFEKEFRADRARLLLQLFIQENLRHLPDVKQKFDRNQFKPYAWAEPILSPAMLKTRPLNGPNWILAGDAAGLVDTVTGEGIPYALQSGRFAASAILSGRLSEYSNRLKTRIIPELITAARMSPGFYQTPLLRGLFFLLVHSKTMRGITIDMTAGHQAYRHIKRCILRGAPDIIRDLRRYRTSLTH
ncbi:MAG: hypothetical protein DSY90_11730 [Deltaproteobacteria bacterium]|nr:MAG: hypothetical protein DSY90_11730 [Deltaproteobacteria bacterium]